MKTFAQFLPEDAADNIRLKKVGLGGNNMRGSHYTGTHQGVPFEVWKTIKHTDTSRPASRADQRAGYGSFASSRKDTVWNWRADGGTTVDGFGTKKSALQHIVSMATRKQGPWKQK
jgi:hypothetical protein